MPFNPAEPSASVFGVIPQARAQRLAQLTGDPTVDAINQLHLGMLDNGGGGTDSYLRAIQESNKLGSETALREMEMKTGADLDVAHVNNAADLSKAGILRGYLPRANGAFRVDPNVIAEGDANAIQAQVSDNFKDVGAGADSLAQAGVAPPTEYIRRVLTPAQSPELIPPIKDGYQTVTQKQSEETDRMNAQANMVSANKPPSGGDNDSGKWKITYGPDGRESGREYTGKGEPPARSGPASKLTYDQAKAKLKSQGAKISEGRDFFVVTDSKGKKATYRRAADGGYTFGAK